MLVVKHLNCGKAGKYVYAQCFGLLGQPAGELAQADDEIAAIVEAVRTQEAWGRERTGFTEKQKAVARHRLRQRCTAFLPVGQQLGQGARGHDRTAKNMRAWLRALFQHAHGQLAAMLDGELPQANRSGEAGLTGADDNDVERHGFAWSEISHAQGSGSVGSNTRL